MERIRKELVEKRRQDCNNIVKERKRRLSELYCVSRLPLLPISNDDVLQIEDKLKSFLDKNDLEKGLEFSISELAHERRQMKNIRETPTTPDVEEPPRKLQKIGTEKTEEEKALQAGVQVGDGEDAQTVTAEIQAVELPAEISATSPPQQLPFNKKRAEMLADEQPTLSMMVRRYAEEHHAGRADERTKRDFDYEDIEIKRLLVTLMPERKPHKVAAARSLIEMYYHQQTLQLPKLLLRAHKTLTSDAFETSLVEGKVSVLYSRIEELKRKHGWALRQPRKYMEPFLLKGNKTHWDYLMSEGKWLSMDMRQERKFKLAQCCIISQAVKDYWTYGKVCCIKTITKEEVNGQEVKVAGESNETGNVEDSRAEDEEEKGTEEDKNDEHEPMEVEKEKSDEIMEEQEKDEPVMEVADIVVQPEEKENGSLEPREDPVVSDDPFLSGNMVEDSYIPPEKASHYFLQASIDALTATEASVITHLPTYEPFSSKELDHVVDRDLYGHLSALLPPPDEAPEWEKIVLRKQDDLDKHTAGFQKALFGPYRRFNVLKPPRPPSIRNIELRIPTIWLPQDDRSLIKYVTEFSFNWEIISAHLSPQPTGRYFSNIERRTPWQCFERYIQLNNRFRFTDMRGVYTVAAKEWLEAAHRVQATTRRRISPLGVGQESIQRGHRRLRWASMLEAVRKLMKKRESIVWPTPQPRKPAEAGSFDTPTPERLSQLKWDRDKTIQQAYAAANSKAQYNSGGALGTGSGAGQHLGAVGSSAAAVAAAAARQIALRRRAAAAAKGQGTIAGNDAASFSPEQLQRVIQMQRARQKQLASQRARQGATRSPTAGAPMSVAGSPAISAANSNTSSAAATPVQGQAGLARPQTQPPQGGQTAARQHRQAPRISFTTAQVSAIISQIQARNPNLSKEQVTRLAVAYLANYQQKIAQRQNARQAQLVQQAQSHEGTRTQSQSNQSSSVQQAQQAQQAQHVSSPSRKQITPQQLAMLANNPRLTPQQRQQVQILQQRQRRRQQQLQQQLQQQQQLAQQRQNNAGSPDSSHASSHTSHGSHGSHGTHHTPTPEEIQQAMNMRRGQRSQQSPQTQSSQLQTPQLQSPSLNSPQLSQTPQLSPPMLQSPHLSQLHLASSPSVPSDANLSLEAIENDILNTDFSLLEGGGASSPNLGNSSLNDPNNTM
ncbi:DEKNAAC100161 [Brettanomyces naardenensis]|uniref:Chromatin modification-related protein EAF1 n=1 Tax=Brettanomyces naardenensis TaxID=13370 RepID=A0A448YGL3_BRENA|nr:DEKNAAC100161 [Brettanomyces naardenensis]